MYDIIKYDTTEEWLKIRQQGIGGSDVAVLMGLSSYKSPLELWKEKVTGEAEYTTSLAAERGKALEPVALREYERITGNKVDKIDGGVLRSKEYPFMQASLDGYVKDKNILIEAKSANTFVANQWGELDAEGICETEEIPPNYYLQVQHYMVVTGFKQCVVVVYFTAIDKIGRYPIQADLETQQIIIDREKDFWSDVNNDRPPTAEARDISITYPKSNGKAFQINPVIKCVLEKLIIAEAKRKEFEKEETELKDKIKLFLKSDEILKDGDKTLLTWKSAKPTNRLDTNALKEEHPDIFKEFTVEKEGSRRFLIKGVKNE